LTEIDLTDPKDEPGCSYCGAAISGVPAEELVGNAHHDPGPAYRAFCTRAHYKAWLAITAAAR
jgi:hypothetical protein